MFEQMNASDVAKWVMLAFAAGFIGFFGKSLGRAMLSVFHKKKEGSPSAGKTSGDDVFLPDVPGEDGLKDIGLEENRQKIAKKALKAQEKAMKKQGKN